MIGQVQKMKLLRYGSIGKEKTCVLDLQGNIRDLSAHIKELSGDSISLQNLDKVKAIPLARDFQEFGFDIIATNGTANLLSENGVTARPIFKVGEGRTNVVDAIKNGEIQIVVNTPMGAQAREDEYEIGRSAIRHKIPAITTISGAQAAVRGIRNIKNGSLQYRSLQEVFR